MLVYGFIKNHGDLGKQAFVIEESKCTNKKFFQLIEEGYTLELNNNFESLEHAYEVLELGYVDENLEEQHAYKNQCSICKRYGHVSKATGRRYHYASEKWIVFNGYVDDQCAADDLDNITWK